MTKSASEEQIARAIDFSKKSQFAMATRRIIYNHSDLGIEDRGYFHVDVMSGVGSGLVIFQNHRFFLLTAKHNLKQLYPESIRNESPIWVPKEQPPCWDHMLDFFMARKIWYVGELISNECANVDCQDLVLIEFFFPIKPMGLPKQFINVEEGDYFLRKDDFFENQILMCSGFPKDSNQYDEVESHHKYTQSTVFNWEYKVGLYKSSCLEGYLEFDPASNVTHEMLNGMSGGPVYSIYHDDTQIKLAGISLTGGGGKLRFLPAYIFHEAVTSYRSARHEVVDEASHFADESERPDMMLKMYCEMEGLDDDYKRRYGL